MKKDVLLSLISLCILLISCQREVDDIPVIPVDSTNIDSTPAGSLIRYVNVDSRNDSFVNNFQYNAKGSLVKGWSNDDTTAGYTIYVRDDRDRLIRIESTSPRGSTPEGNYGGNDVTEIFYSDNSSGKVLYTIYYNLDSADKRRDSVLYFYENNRLSKTFFYNRLDGKLVADYMYMYTYDNKGNVIRMDGYKPNEDGTTTFNLGYEYEFDDHPKPYSFHDDVLNLYSGYALSANNIVKQINHYEDPAKVDFPILLQYIYGSDGKPVSVTQTIDTQSDTHHFFYYYK